MRIIAKETDYYDSVQGISMDKEKLYIRKPEKITRTDGPCIRISNRGHVFNSMLIGFCGKIYPLVKISGPIEDKLFYGESEVIEEWKKINEENGYHPKWLRILKDRDITQIRNFFEHCRHSIDRYQHVFEGKPIFVWQTSGKCILTYNAILKDYEFYRIKDTYTAFQEIEMWLNNQAQPEPHMLEISDEDKLEARGFDRKFSFRKEKKK